MIIYSILIIIITIITFSDNIYSNYVYLDNNATTRPNNSAIWEFNKCIFMGNASAHYGRKSRAIVERTRQAILKCAELDSREYLVVLTSGASESINMFLNTLMSLNPDRKIQTSTYEHKTTLDCLSKYGNNTSYISPNVYGEISSSSFVPMNNLIVTLIMAHNEYGSVNLIDKSELPPCIYHIDAVQGFGKYPLPKADAYSISFHKLNGFPGCGALILHRDLYEAFKMRAQICGTQNYYLRGGTENIPLIASIYGALSEKFTNRVTKNDAALAKKNYILSLLASKHPFFDYRRTDAKKISSPIAFTVVNYSSLNTIYLCAAFNNEKVPPICGKYLCSRLYDDYKIIVSTGSACGSDVISINHLSIPEILKITALRISLDDTTTHSNCRTFVRGYLSIIYDHYNLYDKSR